MEFKRRDVRDRDREGFKGREGKRTRVRVRVRGRVKEGLGRVRKEEGLVEG